MRGFLNFLAALSLMVVCAAPAFSAEHHPEIRPWFPVIENPTDEYMLKVVIIPKKCELRYGICAAEHIFFVVPGNSIMFHKLPDDIFIFKMTPIRYLFAEGPDHNEWIKWREDQAANHVLNLVQGTTQTAVLFAKKLRDKNQHPVIRLNRDAITKEVDYNGPNPWTLPIIQNRTNRWLISTELHVYGFRKHIDGVGWMRSTAKTSHCGSVNYPKDPCSRGRMILLRPGNRVRYQPPEEAVCALYVGGFVSSSFGRQHREITYNNFHERAPSVKIEGTLPWMFPQEGSISIDVFGAKGTYYRWN